ncbi:MAG: hypothetical protein AAF939_02775 [Planctomycetota bacterium]
MIDHYQNLFRFAALCIICIGTGIPGEVLAQEGGYSPSYFRTADEIPVLSTDQAELISSLPMTTSELKHIYFRAPKIDHSSSKLEPSTLLKLRKKNPTRARQISFHQIGNLTNQRLHQDHQVMQTQFLGWLNEDASPEDKSEPVSATKSTSASPVIAKAKSTTSLFDVTPDELDERIQEQKKLINGNESLDEATKTDQLEQLNSASISVQKARNFIALSEKLKAEIETFNQSIKENADDSNTEVAEHEPNKPDKSLKSADLQAQLEDKQEKVSEKKKALEEEQDKTEQKETRATQLPGLQTTAEEALRKNEEEFKKLAGNPDDISKTLSTLALESQKLAIEKELEALEDELKWQELFDKVSPRRRNEIFTELVRLEKEVELWESAFNEAREKEVAEEQRNAELLARDQAIKEDPDLDEMATRNKELADLRVELTNQLKQQREKLKQTKDRKDEIKDRADQLQQKIEKGLTPASGVLLTEYRQSLIQPDQSRMKISELTDEIKTVRQQRSLLTDEQKQLIADDAIEDLYQLRKRTTSIDKFKALVTDLNRSRTEYLGWLIKDYRDYRDLLIELSNEHAKLITSIQESKAYIDKNALWIQSSDPAKWSDFGESVEGIHALLQPKGWQDLSNIVVSKLSKKPYEIVIGLILLAGIFLASYRLRDPRD